MFTTPPTDAVDTKAVSAHVERRQISDSPRALSTMKKSLDHLAVRPHPLSGLVSTADLRESEIALSDLAIYEESF